MKDHEFIAINHEFEFTERYHLWKLPAVEKIPVQNTAADLKETVNFPLSEA